MRTKRVGIATAGFFAFTLWVTYLANTGSDHALLSLPELIPYGDKVGHLVLFGLLTLLVNLTLGIGAPVMGRMCRHRGTVAVLGFVLAEELSQGFVASRTLDYKDFAADLVGIAAGSVISHTILASSFRLPHEA